jgi:rRNA biogenesis protein RRP5
LDPESDFKVGQKIKARVIWDSIGSTPKKFSLSMAKHILAMNSATVAGSEDAEEEDIATRFKVGKILEHVKVLRMDDEWGLTCEILEGDRKTSAFVHVSSSLESNHEF